MSLTLSRRSMWKYVVVVEKDVLTIPEAHHSRCIWSNLFYNPIGGDSRYSCLAEIITRRVDEDENYEVQLIRGKSGWSCEVGTTVLSRDSVRLQAHHLLVVMIGIENSTSTERKISN